MEINRRLTRLDVLRRIAKGKEMRFRRTAVERRSPEADADRPLGAQRRHRR